MPQQVLQATVPSQTILATGDQVVGEVEKAGVVTSVSYTPEAAITGANSPASRTYTLVNKGAAGAGTAVVATLAMTSGVNGVAFDELAATVTSTLADKTVAAGDILAWVSTAVGGTGLVDPGGNVRVEIDASGYTTTTTGGVTTHTQG
jgi:predicted metal-binding membrane protein